jgi:membrane protease YdiL (CAAX protease family)
VLAIPLGTVVLEEVAFRGALPAVLAREWTTLRAVVASSALFGVWHVLPSWGIGDVNPVVDDILGDRWIGRLISVGVAVIGTFVVGLWWSFVRYRSGSLLAPVLAHVGTNSLAYAIAWIVTRSPS